MSIYIKGMEMPKAGAYTCELGVLDENTAVLTINTPINEPQRSYRIIPVPEHGRLIDADALCKDRVSNDNVVICAKCSPTIIPAEEE